MSKPDWENFAKAVLADWPTGDLEGSVLFDLALQYGMIQEVPGGYNSDHHIDADGVCPEEGDPWYEYTFRGEAGPGLYSIHVLTEQLNTCRMAQVVMENTVAELKGKFARAMKHVMDYSNDSHLVVFAEGTLAEIEGLGVKQTG
jgi:hypothetical protein